MKRHGLLAINSIAVFICLLGLWQSLIELKHLPAYILPGPRLVAAAIHDRFPSLMNSLLITTEEAAGGLAASIVAGVGVAMIFAQWRWLRQLLYPYTILLQTVPIVAIAPVVIMWVGAGFCLSPSLPLSFAWRRSSPTPRKD